MQGALAAHESKLRFSYIILPHGGKIKCFALLPRFFCGAFRLRGALSAAKPRSPLGGGTRRPILPRGLSPPSLPVQHGLPVLPVGRFRAACRFRPLSGAVGRFPQSARYPQSERFCRQPALNCPRPPADIFLLSAYARRPSPSFPSPRRLHALRTSRTNPLGGGAIAARALLNKMLTICIHIIVELKAAKW